MLLAPSEDLCTWATFGSPFRARLQPASYQIYSINRQDLLVCLAVGERPTPPELGHAEMQFNPCQEFSTT
jgi:hypothetical protein